jgi:hypothetical protein
MISTDTAIIYSQANTNAEVLETKHGGDEIIISNFHKDGWFKIKTNAGTNGWIQQKNIAIGQERMEVKMANLDLNGQKRQDKSRETPPWLFFRPSLGALGLSTSTVGATKFNSTASIDFMFDLSIRLDYGLRLLMRGGYYKTGVTGTADYSIYQYGLPALLGLELELSKSMGWSTWFNVMGGINMNTFVISQAGSTVSVTANSKDILAMMSLMFKKTMSNTIKLTLEPGFYYSPTSSKSIGAVSFLQVAGSPDSIRSRFMGPFVQIGLELAL